MGYGSMVKAIFPGLGPENMTREELVAYNNKLNVIAARYRRSQEALRLDEARLEALLMLNEMATAPEEDIIAYSLEEAIRLTGSKIGWMGALSVDEKTLIMHCWSKGTKEECGILDQPHVLSVGGGGIWVEPILKRKPVVVNDYEKYHKKSIPYGHVPVRRFMGIPVYDGTRIVAVAEVGNKGSDYDSSDLRQLSLLMSGVWRIIMRKRAEEALSESKAQAELYVDFMSHDISNMNQVAMGFLELAIEKLSAEGRLEKSDMALLVKPMDTIKNSAKLIDNVKKLQRLRAGMLEPMLIDLGQVLSEIKDDTEGRNDRRISIHYAPVSGFYVHANELLKDIFSNIVNNSIKHSRPNKPVSIMISLTTSENGYRVSIEDNGPGISDGRKNEIFDRLSSGKMKALRTGLGLGLVKTLVESYHGRIWVEDRVAGDYRQGCRFIVELPDAAHIPCEQNDMTRAH
jgi:signal transduction histidine kinase